MAMTQLDKQEALGFCAGSAWKKVVHGFTVNIPDTEAKSHG